MSRYRVAARLDGALAATVEIDRERMLFIVRPLRRRTTYALPLSTVAELVAWRVLRSEHGRVVEPPARGHHERPWLRLVARPDDILWRGEELRADWFRAGRSIVGPVAYCQIHDKVFFFACPGIGHRCRKRALP